MVPIHEKISTLLEQRKLKRRDLATALGVSPQTATDICKGRSAVTMQHLRNLVEYFGLRPDYWLDESRLLPGSADHVTPGIHRRIEAVARCGLLGLDDPVALMRRVRSFVREHQRDFVERHADLSGDERRVLGLSDPGRGIVGVVHSSE